MPTPRLFTGNHTYFSTKQILEKEMQKYQGGHLVDLNAIKKAMDTLQELWNQYAEQHLENKKRMVEKLMNQAFDTFSSVKKNEAGASLIPHPPKCPRADSNGRPVP